MNSKDNSRGQLPERTQSSLLEIGLPKTQIQDIQMELNILRETLDVLKKTPASI